MNVLLRSLMPSTSTMLAGDTLGLVAEDSGQVGRLLAFWDICQARDLAWNFANHLRNLSATEYAVALARGLTRRIGHTGARLTGRHVVDTGRRSHSGDI